jgi:hypothetical protein
MRRPFVRSTLRRGLGWLLGLALLLPMAQLASAWHGVAHLRAEVAADDGGKQAQGAAHCELCLLAAAVGGGALPSLSPSLALPAARHAAPAPEPAALRAAAPALAYRSRAPPPPLR